MPQDWWKQTIIWLLLLLVTSQAQATEPVNRLAHIQSQGKLQVCIWPEYFSISYRNQKTQQLEGIDIDLSRALATDLGVGVEYVFTHFGAFMQDLQQEKCDIAMFGIGNTEQRRQQVDFSASYLSSGMYAIVPSAHPFIKRWEDLDQPGVIVCVQKGTYMEHEMRKGLQHASLLTVEKPNQREVEVRSGRADVFITDYPYGRKMITQYDWATLLAPSNKSTAQFQYAYAVKKDQPAWLARVNTFVEEIKKDGRLSELAEKHSLSPIVVLEN